MRRLAVLLVALALVTTACGDDNPAVPETPAAKNVTLKLVTHDSFAVSDEVLEAFTADTGIKVQVVESGDAGEALNKVILTRDDPIGDVFFGVDNAFLTRALDAGVFTPYRSPRLAVVDRRYVLDPENRVTPIDHGEVCVNFDKQAFGDTPPPNSFDDLVAPAMKGKLVVENPATSSPGLAFLAGTIAKYGEDGWQDYWRKLKANDVQVVNGWEEAYNTAFSGGAGKGLRPLVVSYASSPAAEVVFADPPRDDAPTGVSTATCVEQIELAGILGGTAHEPEAKRLVDFLLSKRFQEDIPLQMFVYPVAKDARLPDVFVQHAAAVADPLRLDPAQIGKRRDEWIKEWTSIVLA